MKKSRNFAITVGLALMLILCFSNTAFSFIMVRGDGATDKPFTGADASSFEVDVKEYETPGKGPAPMFKGSPTSLWITTDIPLCPKCGIVSVALRARCRERY